MKLFFEILFKGSVIICAAVFVIFIIFVLTDVDDEIYRDVYEGNQAYTEAWLKEMEVEEDENLSAERLQKYCEAKDAQSDGFCVGYLLGFIEGHGISTSIAFCDNGSLRSASQAKQSLSNFMEDHPEHWKKARGPILGAALQASFPCTSD